MFQFWELRKLEYFNICFSVLPSDLNALATSFDMEHATIQEFYKLILLSSGWFQDEFQCNKAFYNYTGKNRHLFECIVDLQNLGRSLFQNEKEFNEKVTK